MDYIIFKNGIFSDYSRSEFIMNGICFCSSKTAYAYLKAKFFNDERIMYLSSVSTNPGSGRDFSKSVRGFNEEKWSTVRYKCLVYILKHKFTQNNNAMNELLNTENKNIYFLSKNKKLGIINFVDGMNENEFIGENLLGKALVETREWIKQKKEPV